MALDVRVELSRMSGALVWAALLHSTLLSHSVGSRSPQTKRREDGGCQCSGRGIRALQEIRDTEDQSYIDKAFQGAYGDLKDMS